MSRSDWARAHTTARAVLAANHGLAPLSAFVAAGLTPYQVAAIHRQEEMMRPRIGWYLATGLPWFAGPAVRVGGVATCVSAAEAWGLPVPPDPRPRVHVCLSPHASRLRHSRDRTWRAPAGTDRTAHLHWTVCIEEPIGWRVGVVDTLLQLADCVPIEWFVAAVDAALHRPRFGKPILSTTDYDRLRAHLPQRLLPALDLVDARAESCIETLLRLGLIRRGVRDLALQVWTTPRDRVDLLLRGKVIVEADGEEFHDPEQDAIRDALMRSLGYLVLRFPYARIVHDLDAVLDEIEVVLDAL